MPLFLVIVISLCVIAPLNGQERKRNEGLTTAEAVKDNYRYLIAGIREDLPRNRAYALRYRKKYFEARAAKQASAKDYYNVAHYFQQLADANAAILEALSGKDHGALDEPMKLVPKIEGRIMYITGRAIERKWLTTDEMMQYVKAGIPYRSAANHILPYATACWDPKRVQQHKNGQAVTPQQNKRRER